jgi:hypothetical protein
MISSYFLGDDEGLPETLGFHLSCRHEDAGVRGSLQVRVRQLRDIDCVTNYHVPCLLFCRTLKLACRPLPFHVIVCTR